MNNKKIDYIIYKKSAKKLNKNETDKVGNVFLTLRAYYAEAICVYIEYLSTGRKYFFGIHTNF